jgi:hypothetical protein
VIEGIPILVVIATEDDILVLLKIVVIENDIMSEIIIVESREMIITKDVAIVVGNVAENVSILLIEIGMILIVLENVNGNTAEIINTENVNEVAHGNALLANPNLILIIKNRILNK